MGLMSSSNDTRSRILDAYTELVIEGGERLATLEAAAARAKVSKGGLLYHFPSKQHLLEAFLARFVELTAADAESIRQSSSQPIDELLRTSVSQGSPLDQALIAAVRLAQGSAAARDSLAQADQLWLALIEETVPDEALARTILLISDGLYYGSALRDHDMSADLAAAQQTVRALLAAPRG